MADKKDVGTAIRHERGELTQRNGRAYVTNRWVIDYYRDHKRITQDQHEAAYRFFKDYTIAHKSTSTMELLMRVDGKDRKDINENKATAKDRYLRAIKGMNKTDYLIATNVICGNYAMQDIKQELKWNARNSGIDRLRETLNHLADFYLPATKKHYHTINA